MNRLKTGTFADGGTITLTWDAGNRPTAFADSQNGTITRVYDGLDRLKQESGPQGTVDYVYDDAGRRTQMTVSGQSAVTYQYDNGDRLTQIAQGTNVVTLGYDNADRRTSVSLPGGISGTFGFDSASQLTSITYAGVSQTANATYTYDTAGHRSSASGSLVQPIDDSTLPGVGYDSANRLTSLIGTSLTYDNDGQLTGISGSTPNSFTWNARGQLVSTGRGTSLAYDAIGRLVSKTTGGVTTTYLYDGANQVKANGDLLMRGPGPDELFAKISAGSALTYLTDALGSPAMLASGGAVVAQYQYGAYGATAKSGSADTPFKFTGADYNSTDDLYYFRSRYYSPSLQRFISEDPIGLSGGLNVYAYVSGNPISFVDPYGLDVMGVTGGMREGTNPFGHSAMAVEGHGMYSYGNSTPLGSSALGYIRSQSAIRNQLITVVPRTPAQDAAALAYFKEHPNMNDVGKLDNCAVRTSSGLQASGVPIEGSIFPGGLARSLAGVPGTQTFFIPKGGEIPAPLLEILKRF